MHNFGNGTDGIGPGPLIMDAAGNLYGTTQRGGTHGAGTVFELSPSEGGWTETVLYNFAGGNDGYLTVGSLLMDTAGNLYGMTLYGGLYSEGIAFELSPNGVGGWTETVLHNFGNGTDGAFPDASLILDAAGNLYGTTMEGGIYCYDCGTVFELSPNGVGGWTETVLHNFNGSDGFERQASLISDTAGNLYGTTFQGGMYSFGNVFEMSPGEGGWTETVLHNFNQDGHDGYEPQASLILDRVGNLYGTTNYGGINLYGTVFELSHRESGWIETVLYNFGNDNGNNGDILVGSVLMDRAGNLYGTTINGGVYYAGVIFELTPSSIRPRALGTPLQIFSLCHPDRGLQSEWRVLVLFFSNLSKRVPLFD